MLPHQTARAQPRRRRHTAHPAGLTRPKQTRRVSQLTHHWTYHDVVSAEYGAPGLLALKLAIIVNNAGSMVRAGQRMRPLQITTWLRC